MNLIRKIKNKLFYEAKKLLDRQEKKDQILFAEPWNLEVNMVEMANYLAEHTRVPIYFAVPKRLMHSARKILAKNIYVLNGDNWLKLHRQFYASKYFFTAHWKKPSSYSKEQTIINLWHGIPYKRISRLHGKGVGGVSADITLATSPLTKNIFIKAFGVPKESVVNCGYPRNDVLVRNHKNKTEFKQKIKGRLNQYEKVLIWLPTLRKDFVAGHKTHGTAVENAFQVKDFDVNRFNAILNNQDTLCIVKPHPFSVQDEPVQDFSNIFFINDQWLFDQGITLYHLAACTDGLISDVSSIIIDYLLIDKPVICLSADFDKYKKERGFAFDDLDEWMPTHIIKSQNEFFEHLQTVLQSGKDKYKEKRKKLRDLFFTHHDDQSAKRILEFLIAQEPSFQKYKK